MAFIPARGGSKGIPRKNLALLNGIPLIQYTIDAAKKSKYITDIFLSSDDIEIIEVAKTFGLEVPYVRPPELATDQTSMADSLIHALNWLKENTCSLPDLVLLLQPTSPLRTSRHIDEAIRLFIEKDSSSLISVHKMVEHPYECLKVKKGEWEFLAKSPDRAERRQDYTEEFYYINGAIYLVKTSFFMEKKLFVVEGKTLLYLMDSYDGVDIDDSSALKKAEIYMKIKGINS